MILFVSENMELVGLLVALVCIFIWTENRRGGKSLTSQQLTDMVNSQDAKIIDIRDKAEFQAGHIVNAENIPFSGIDAKIEELSKFTQPIILVDKMGQHGATVGKKLTKAGCENVYRLSGGIAEWKGNQMPLVRA